MSAEPAPPARRVGRYVLHGEIASGGMATVYLGRQRGQAGFARTVAIKRLHPQHAKEPDFVAMFLDEARLAARVRHPNVVPTLDVVATDGELFLVMEYVEGESLSKLLRATRDKKERAPTRIVAAIMADVLHGLHAAHEATNERGEALGLVHRDVSPHNILIGTDGVARVVDFGVAKAAGRIQTTREGQLKGKIAYMSPEQITGTVTRRTDVYAATVVLWEALTNKRLFVGENDANVMNQVINSKVLPPSTHVPDLDAAWDEITLHGLERDEEKRFATAREMALEIEGRFQLARATEVGAWVESLASASLARRAADVSAVESASDVDIVPHDDEGGVADSISSASAPIVPQAAPSFETVVDPGPPAGASPVAAESTGSRLSGVSWLSQPSLAKKKKRSARLALGAAGVVVAATIALVFVKAGGGKEPEAPAAAPSADPLPAATSPAAVAPAPIPSPSSIPAPPPTPCASVAVAPPPKATPAPRPKAAAAPAATKGASLGSVLDTRR